MESVQVNFKDKENNNSLIDRQMNLNTNTIRFDGLFQNDEKWNNLHANEPSSKALSDINVGNNKPRTSGDEDLVHNDYMDLKSIWGNFLANTTLHGVFQIQRKDLNVPAKIIWGIFLLGMFGNLAWVLTDLLVRYREYPFISEWNVRRESAIDTPTLTLCPFKFYNVTKIQELMMTSVESFWDNLLTDLNPEDEKKDPYNETFSALMDVFGFSTEEMVISMDMHYDRVELIDSTRAVTKRYLEERLCFTVNDFRDEYQLPDKVTHKHVISLVMNMQSRHVPTLKGNHGLALYIHKKGTTMSNLDPVLISPGYTTYVQYTQTDFTFLPLPFKSFAGYGCLDLDNPDHQVPRLLKFPVYTRGNCMVEYAEKLSAEICKCVQENYEDVFGVEECTIYQMTMCVWNLRYFIETNSTDGHEKECPHSCQETRIDTTNSQTMWFHEDSSIRSESTRDPDQQRDFVHIVVQARSNKVNTVKHVPKMTTSGIFAEVGGFMGLFLGASFLTIAELIQVFMASVRYFITNKRKKN